MYKHLPAYCVQTSLFTYMMADIGLVVCADGGQVEGLVVECLQYIRIVVSSTKGQS